MKAGGRAARGGGRGGGGGPRPWWREGGEVFEGRGSELGRIDLSGQRCHDLDREVDMELRTADRRPILNPVQ